MYSGSRLDEGTFRFAADFSFRRSRWKESSWCSYQECVFNTLSQFPKSSFSIFIKSENNIILVNSVIVRVSLQIILWKTKFSSFTRSSWSALLALGRLQLPPVSYTKNLLRATTQQSKTFTESKWIRNMGRSCWTFSTLQVLKISRR